MSSAALNQRNPNKENMDAISSLKKDDIKKSGLVRYDDLFFNHSELTHFFFKVPKVSSRSRRLAVSSALNVDKKNHDERQENKKNAEKGRKTVNDTPNEKLVTKVSMRQRII